MDDKGLLRSDIIQSDVESLFSAGSPATLEFDYPFLVTGKLQSENYFSTDRRKVEAFLCPLLSDTEEIFNYETFPTQSGNRVA